MVTKTVGTSPTTMDSEIMLISPLYLPYMFIALKMERDIPKGLHYQAITNMSRFA